MDYNDYISGTRLLSIGGEKCLFPQATTINHDRYRIESLLGQGGMGAVYRAWDTTLDVPAAIKENLDASPQAQKQFIREANILARLSHQNLPRVTDYFFVAGHGVP